MSYPNYVFSIFAFVGFLLVSIPFPWHLEAWNTGTCIYMLWTSIACLNQFINSIVWNGNAINWAPVWCDISSRIMVGTAVAIPAASLCINRRLYHIACVSTVTVTKAEKRRAIMVDIAIGMGLPLLEIPLQYIAEGHRFNIFEDVGCYPFTYNTPVGYALVSVPPIAIGLVSATYCILSIRAFNKRRTQFKELLSANSNLNSNRYFRLMCLAGVEILCTVPLGSWAIYLNSTAGVISPWKGWADTHSHFSRVDQFPSLLWRSNPLTQASIELSRWSVVICAFIFFAFFGFADEARKHYRLAIQSVAKHVGYSTASMSSGMTSTNGGKSKSYPNMSSTGRGITTLPVFVRRETTYKRDSFDSFSDMSIADVGGALGDVKEKPYSPTLSFGALSLPDVGGALADYKADPYSPASSSGSSTSGSDSSASSILPPASEQDSPAIPEPAVTLPNATVETQSIRRLSLDASPISPTFPAPVLDATSLPRHSVEPLSHSHSLNIV